MNFKKNFCCWCCVELKAKSFVQASCIYFIVLGVFAVLNYVINILRDYKGVTAGFWAIYSLSIALDILMVILSICILSQSRSNNFRHVKAYSIYMIVMSFISMGLVFVSLFVHLHDLNWLDKNKPNLTPSALDYLTFFGVFMFFFLVLWMISLSFSLVKASADLKEGVNEGGDEEAPDFQNGVEEQHLEKKDEYMDLQQGG